MIRVHNGAQLASALSDIGDSIEKDLADDVLKKLTFDGLRMLIRRTPVDTGFLKSRWSVDSTGNPPEKVEAPSPGASYSLPNETLPPIEWGDIVTIYNNTEYAEYIEEGTPLMRPQPMVKPTFDALQVQARAVAQAISRDKVRK